MIEIKDKTKLVIDGNEVEIKVPIKTFIELPDRILILQGLTTELYAQPGDLSSRNILCYDRSGNFLWRVEKVKEDLYVVNNFSSLYLEDDVIKSYNVNSITYIINPETGEVTRITTFPKSRPW